MKTGGAVILKNGVKKPFGTNDQCYENKLIHV